MLSLNTTLAEARSTSSVAIATLKDKLSSTEDLLHERRVAAFNAEEKIKGLELALEKQEEKFNNTLSLKNKTIEDLRENVK